MVSIKSVSLPDDLAKWAQLNQVSLSGVLQQALQKMKNPPKPEITVEAATKLAILSDRFHKALRFIEEKGVLDEFLAKKN